MKILVADDEREIRNVLRLLLEREGCEVILASNGNDAVRAVEKNPDLDLCIMDIMMPRLTGVEATAHIREFSNVPILFLTAKSLDADRAEAYRAGGDDYLVKPFSGPELLLKVDAIVRRYNQYRSKPLAEDADTIRLGSDITIAVSHREVHKGGVSIDIRDKEFDVLVYRAKNRGTTISAPDLYQAVWNEMPLPSSSNTVTVHILNLRRKLEDVPSSPKVIRTIWGKGYQID